MIAIIRNSALLLTAAGLLSLASCQKEEASTTKATTNEAALEIPEASRPTATDLDTLSQLTTASAVGLQSMARTSNTATSSNCGPYQIKLESTVANSNNTYTWKWSVKNPNPGNGYCGTLQDLDWWAIKLDNCTGAGGAKLSNVVSAAVSCNGSTWYSFNPTCYYSNGYVIFPYGTNGNSKTYYRITLNKDFELATNAPAYYNSGCRTGQGCTCHPGIGCEEEPPVGGGSNE